MPKGVEVDVNQEMGRVAAEVIVRTLFSDALGPVSAQVFEAFMQYQRSLGRLAFGELTGLGKWVPRLHRRRGHRAVARLNEVVDGIIERRRASGVQRHDLLGTLLAVVEWDEAANSAAFIREMLKVMLLAGHESTANTMSWALYLLERHPEHEARLRAELDTVLQGREPSYEDVSSMPFMRAVLQETTRLYPPIPLYSRQAVEDDRIHGRSVPAGSLVIISPWLVHRHRKLWSQPEVFDPDRFLAEDSDRPRYAYIPFSAGPRTCLGGSFAMVEMTVIITMLLQRYRLQLRPNHAVEPRGLLTVRPRHGMPMTLEPLS